MWKDYQSIPPRLTEIEFDDRPAGFYACYTGYVPATRLGSLPTAIEGYLIAVTFQHPADRIKYYKWISSINGEEWEAYFKNGVSSTWIMSSEISKSEDTMTGDLNMSGNLVKGLPVNYLPVTYVGDKAVDEVRWWNNWLSITKCWSKFNKNARVYRRKRSQSILYFTWQHLKQYTVLAKPTNSITN